MQHGLRATWYEGIAILHLHLHLGFVHPLQDVALHQCLPSSSVCCFPNPGGSLLLCYVILPSSAWSSSGPLPSPNSHTPSAYPQHAQIFLPHRVVVFQRRLSAAVTVCLLVACLTSQQQASVSQGPICSDNFTCCHTEIAVSDQTFYLTQSQYTDTGPTSPSAEPNTPGAWQGSHWNANFEVTGMTRPRKNPGASGIRTRDLPLSRRTP